MDVQASARQSAPGTRRRPIPDDAGLAPLPGGYGSDRIVLMLRDPTWAHVYWDMSVAHIGHTVGVLGGGGAFLRLLAVPEEQLVAEYEVSAERGKYGVALAESGRSYVAELALVHNERRAVLARSEVIHSPPRVANPTATPAFVSRAEQLRALANGVTLARTGAVPHPAATRARSVPVSFGSMGSEGRLSGFGSEPSDVGRGAAGRLGEDQGVPTASATVRSGACALSAVAAAASDPPGTDDALTAGRAHATALVETAQSDAATGGGQPIAATGPPSSGSHCTESGHDAAGGSPDRGAGTHRPGRFWPQRFSRLALPHKLRRRG